MTKIGSVVDRIAPTDLAVLITGESGVGKEVIARKICRYSPRRDQPFVKINSAALPNGLIESELFGHSEGAFTGANANRKGLVRTAHQGTLFFDEIAELSPVSQSKVLHIIQDKVFTPLGSNKSIKVDIRVLAATNRDVLKEVKSGHLLEGLYYRLNVVHIQVPPLRECKEDILGCFDYFLTKYSRTFKRANMPVIKESQHNLITTYDWPGNIRELENFAKSLVLVDDTRAAFDGIRKKVRTNPIDKPSLLAEVRLVKEEVQRKIIGRVLRRNGWNRKKTAEMLNISYRSLLSKIKTLEIE